jgi:hypothetical protein
VTAPLWFQHCTHPCQQWTSSLATDNQGWMQCTGLLQWLEGGSASRDHLKASFSSVSSVSSFMMSAKLAMNCLYASTRSSGVHVYPLVLAIPVWPSASWGLSLFSLVTQYASGTLLPSERVGNFPSESLECFPQVVELFPECSANHDHVFQIHQAGLIKEPLQG